MRKLAMSLSDLRTLMRPDWIQKLRCKAILQVMTAFQLQKITEVLPHIVGVSLLFKLIFFFLNILKMPIFFSSIKKNRVFVPGEHES